MTWGDADCGGDSSAVQGLLVAQRYPFCTYFGVPLGFRVYLGKDALLRIWLPGYQASTLNR